MKSFTLMIFALVLTSTQVQAAPSCRSLDNTEVDEECSGSALHAVQLMNDMNYTRKAKRPYTEISLGKRSGSGSLRTFEVQAYNGTGADQMVETYSITLSQDLGNKFDCRVIRLEFKGNRSVNPENNPPPPVEEGRGDRAI